jgi:hypothetical protein
MFGDGALTFREFAMGESLPLAMIHDAVLDYLRGRDDAVLYGAQAVNAYVDEPRMTQDVDILSTRAADLAEEIRTHLNTLFNIAVRVRSIREGIGYRVYQIRKPKNRHLVDLRPVDAMPETQIVDGVRVLAPIDLISHKIISTTSRSKTAKGLIDAADLRRLVLKFPDLKRRDGPVRERLKAVNADERALAAWDDLVTQEIAEDDEDDEFTGSD